jgi:hypothetical protein
MSLYQTGPNTLRVKYHYVTPFGVNGTFYDIASLFNPNHYTVKPAFHILGDWFVRVEVISGVTTLFSNDYWVIVLHV